MQSNTDFTTLKLLPLPVFIHHFFHLISKPDQKGSTLTVDGDAGLGLVIFAGHLPDVEGLSRGVGQQPEHEDDGVGVRKAVRVDVSAQREDVLPAVTADQR